MKTRSRAEHILRASSGEAFASVTIQQPGRSTPQVNLVAQDNRPGAGNVFVQGFLTIEAAELLRRALNDVLEPLQQAHEKEVARDTLRSLARELVDRQD